MLASTVVVRLPEGSADDAFLRRLEAEDIDTSPFVRSERRYAAAELSDARLFWVHLQRQPDDGYTVFGTRFDASAACGRCGAGIVQKSPLIVRRSKFSKFHIAASFNMEVIVSEALAGAIGAMTGFELCPVIDHRTKKKCVDLLQLKPRSILPPLVAPTSFAKGKHFCELCGSNGVFLNSEMHIREKPVAADVYRTAELFGEMRKRACPGPELVFSRRLIEAIRRLDAKALDVEPVYLGGTPYGFDENHRG